MEEPPAGDDLVVDGDLADLVASGSGHIAALVDAGGTVFVTRGWGPASSTAAGPSAPC